MIEIDPKNETTAKVHALLLGSIAPRPIAFASTVDKEGNPNLSPFSFFNCFSAHPPIVVFSPARRGRDNTTKHTFENVKEVPEVVINMVSYSMVQQASLASVEYPKGVNEFTKAGFTQVPSQRIRPFRVNESPVQLECKVNQIIELGHEGGAGNLVICEVLLFHVNESILTAEGKIDPQKIDLVARMGGDFYCRASGDAVFEVEKPNTKIGIGVDSIPLKIRNSKILTGNNLGQLGNAEHLPVSEETKSFLQSSSQLKSIFETSANHPELLDSKIHFLAKTFLDEGKVKEAWMALLARADMR